MADLSEIEQLAVAMSESLEGCVVSAGDGYELDAEQAYEMILEELKQFRQDDPNRLPMDLLPERGWLEHLWSSIDRETRTRIFHCIVAWEQPRTAGIEVSVAKSHGIGPTPRAAMMAAIGKIGLRKEIQ